MRRILILAIALHLMLICGCPNFNPRLRNEINNSNGQIDEIRNNQNGISLELGKIKQDTEISNSKIEEMQQGMFNINASASRNENSGVQILQGDGALILVFSLGVIGMILYHYRDRAIKSEKAAEIMAQQIISYGDPVLNDNVLFASMHTDSEKRVYSLMKKHS